MKLIVRIFSVLVGLWLLLVLVGFLLPGHYRVERSIVVSAGRGAVFPRVGDLRAWKEWGVWFGRDPGMKISYSPATTEVGAFSQWTSASQGDGKMTITSTRPPDSFVYRMDFSDTGMVAEGGVALSGEPGGGTRVVMSMEGDLGRSPVQRWFGLFMDRLIGPDFEACLVNLKRLCEAPPR
jgi:hypothetical protein